MKRESITFARNLKNLRNSQKLTMQQMAEKLGAVRQTVSDWEKGTASPGIDILANVCKIFDVSADTMMFGNILDEVNFEDNYEEHKRVIFPRKNEGEEPKGIYRPIDVDIEYLEDIWNITEIEFSDRLVIAIGLYRKGYKITDIYEANLLSSLIFSDAYVISSCDGRLYKTLQVSRLLYLSIISSLLFISQIYCLVSSNNC